MKLILSLITAAALLSGCVSVTPQMAAKLDTDAANARAFDKKVQALTTPVSDADLAAIKQWSAADAKEWTSQSDWAHGRAPTTQP